MKHAHPTRLLLWALTLIAPTLLLIFFLLSLPTAYAQTEVPQNPTGPRRHIVAAGENLTLIADQYGVSVADLQLVNQLKPDDILAVGREIIIPGGDVRPTVIIHQVAPGDSVQSIATGFGLDLDAVLQTNRSINRDYTPPVGQSLAMTVEDGSAEPAAVTGFPHVVAEGETLLEIAARYNVPVSHLMYMNELTYPVTLLPGQRLRIPGEEPYSALPGEWAVLRIKPEAIFQGDTVSIFIKNLLSGTPQGSFAGRELHFTPFGDGYVALLGIDAFTTPGSYALQLGGSGDRPWSPFEQSLLIGSADYVDQEITVPEELDDLLEPSIRTNEDAFLSSIYDQFSPQRRWQDLFQVPVTDTVVTAPYGGGRSYNEGPVTIFHTGTDFNGNIGTPILAAADGTVVFSDVLELRGNTVIVDHGWGVMTGYYHLDESHVETGQNVTKGQQIGTGGSTGLSTGPHLHWELRVNDVAVDGMRWTEEPFP
ncbi:MAG: peptidoglycan DD-metalloendopeptidase family protein [Candidatus Promineifilaceae bacterium]